MRVKNFGCSKMGYVRLAFVTTLLFLMSFILSVRAEERVKSLPTCNFPAIYNFGDSNSDTGGISAAFYPAVLPYGETFFHKPVGRASDGRLIIDFIAEHLGLPYLNAYLDSLGTGYMHGANFATGSSTVRPDNQSFSAGGPSPFSLDIQTVQFTQFKSRSIDLFGDEQKRNDTRLPRPEEFAKALYTFDIGQNDIARASQNLNNDQLQAAITDMINQLATAIQNVYEQGGRTFWIHNTGPLGCLPVATHYYNNPPPGILDQNGCVKEQNDVAVEFNGMLKSKVIELRQRLPDAALVYVDVYAAKFGLVGSAKAQGFTDPNNICCGYHLENTHVYCGNKGMVNGSEIYAGTCKDPQCHISWDGIHYTDAANHWIANPIINGSLSDPPLPIKQACHANV